MSERPLQMGSKGAYIVRVSSIMCRRRPRSACKINSFPLVSLLLLVLPLLTSAPQLLMVGDSAAGKTSLVLRFDQNVFSTKFVTTIGVDYRDKTVTLSSTPLRLQLWDTAGQERFRSLTSNFFGRADGFALAFDLTRRESFESVRGWMKDINAR